MLHMVWVIIKFILIVLAALLGLLLVLLLLVLFCPVTYRGRAAKNGRTVWKEGHVSGRISWLFGGISLRCSYEDGEREIMTYLFGISWKKIHRTVKKIKSLFKKRKPKPPGRPAEIWSEEPVPKQTEDDRKEESDAAPKTQHLPEREEISLPSEEKSRTPGVFHRIWEKLKMGLTLPKRIYQKIRKIKLTISHIYGKISWWEEFIHHPRVQEAVSLLMTDGKKLLRHILPTRITGHVVFDSEDPALTGAVLAFLGMSVPFHKNCIAVTPLFENENYLEGDVRLKGRIYGFLFLKTALELYFNKNIKYAIYRWKHKEA